MGSGHNCPEFTSLRMVSRERVHSSPLGFRPSIAHPFMCAPRVWHFVIDSALFDFVLTWERVACFLSTTSQTNMYFNLTCCVRPNPRLDAHAFSHSLSTWFTRVTSYTSSFKTCFVTIPSAIPVVQAYSSASAEHELTDRCVRDHAERVALHQLHFSTACALASHGLPWQVAVCAHVHGLWVYQMMSIKLSLLLGHRSSIV